MKLIKKLTTILFAFMMVLSATTMVFAADTGKITINNAIPGQEYKIYKILELESYDHTSNLYAYKLTSNDWKDFIKNDTEGKKYLEIVDDDMGIVKKKAEFTDATAKDFAKAALAYAKNHSTITPTAQTAPPATGGATTSTVEFTGLGLGYYLVDSSAGVLCSLDTLSTDVIIKEKNTVPTVEKMAVSSDGTLKTVVNENIGTHFFFNIKITVGEGAQNYVLHDKADDGINIDYTSFAVELNSTAKDTTFYKVVKAGETGLETTNPCNFHIEFLDCSNLKKGDVISVTYQAFLNQNALIKSDNTNKAWIAYGDNEAKSNISEAKVKTFEIPVYKFYKDNTTSGETALAGATFKLTDATNNVVHLIKSQDEDPTAGATKTLTYRRPMIGETNTVTEFTTPSLGKITIKGLAAGTYYLTETAAPSGYNKLNNPIEINIDDNGGVTYKEKGSTGASTDIATTENLVKIENRTGVVLPSTGGVGTTMMYIVGAALLIGSGVLLITKKNAK